jgi:hypothetical protein
MVSVVVLRTGSGFFPHWVLFLVQVPRSFCLRLRLSCRFSPPPFVGWLGVVSVPICEAKNIWRAELGIASAPGQGDLQKAQRNRFINRRLDAVSLDTVTLKVVVGYRKPAVPSATVMGQLNLNTAQDTLASKAQRSIRRGFEHLDKPGSKLRLDLRAATATHASGGSPVSCLSAESSFLSIARTGTRNRRPILMVGMSPRSAAA